MILNSFEMIHFLSRINDELLCLRRSVEISSDLKESSHEIKALINLAFASKTYGEPPIFLLNASYLESDSFIVDSKS